MYIKGRQKKGHTSRVILTTHQKWCFVFFVEAFKNRGQIIFGHPRGGIILGPKSGLVLEGKKNPTIQGEFP